VTVLFADVSGSTALGEALDPEDLRSLLARYYTIAREVVESHGGTVEKFIGDAVMAVFGLPHAHDDDPRRALSAALVLRDRVRGDPGLGERLPIRLGLNTGEVVASRDVTEGDFLITGDAVNVAARLQQVASPWEILVGERTVRASADGFAFEPSRSVEVRGKGAALPARPLVGVAVSEGSRRRTPLVGRDADLAQLELLARRAFSERRPFLVSIIAPPGIGKSRLLQEFLDRLPTIAADAEVALAQCLPYGQRLTYWPLRSLLLQLLDLDDDAPAERIRSGAEQWLRGLGDPEARRTAELLAATLGASEAEISDRAALFAAWRGAIELAGTAHPVVLVVEDLHWSSDTLLDLVEYILQPRRGSPLLMVALSRPELLDRRPTWGGGRRNYVSLALEPLGEGDVGRLVGNLLDGPAPEIVDAVVKRAEGNPFYAEEIVRSVLERTGGASDPEAIAVAVAELPDTVQGTVLARIDLLAEDPRRVLQLGSVFGRDFEVDGIATLEPGLAGATREAVDMLVERELVFPGQSGAYAFRHILIREVAYQTLTRAERARLHAAAGSWLEGMASGREDERAELIAFHFREAATLAASVGAADPQLQAAAVRWLRRAAEQAFAGAADIEAAAHLRAAIGLAEADLLPELHFRFGHVQWGGREAADAFLTAYRLGRDRGRSPRFLLLALAEMLMVLRRWYGSVAGQPSEEEVEVFRREARALLPLVDDELARATFLVAESFAPFWIENSGLRLPTADEERDARSAAEAGLEAAERLGDVRLVSAALDGLETVFHATDPAYAREISRRRLRLGGQLDFLERLDAQQMVAWTSALLGDLEETLRAATEALAALQPGQAPAAALLSAAWRCWALAALGRWSEMRAALEAARELWVEADRPSAGYALHGFVAAALVGEWRRDEAMRQRAREVVDEIAGQFAAGLPLQAWASLARGDLPALENELVRYQRHQRRAAVLEMALAACVDRGQPVPMETVVSLTEFAAARGLRPLEAQGLRAQGLAARDAALLSRALEIYEACKAVPRAAVVAVELGRLRGDPALVERGLSALESLGDLDALERLGSAADQGPERA